jgi:hypothetical protein
VAIAWGARGNVEQPKMLKAATNSNAAAENRGVGFNI